MASTDFYERLHQHATSLKAKRFEFGRGEPKEPSAADLDAVAEEQKAAEATSGAVQE